MTCYFGDGNHQHAIQEQKQQFLPHFIFPATALENDDTQIYIEEAQA